ncbi:hypothetical protein NQ315_014615 [Exocentrus adspersus]|uniref:Uncharacterized protein n=1 Tax=Exocentrus adspersus TaxID=1586481 RepID=A0AAV8VQD0_9CUCU|nr:hypothetical protein NQ315_014615 [Exocentrus adspersus]
MKRGQEELKQKLEDKLQEMKTIIEDSNTKLENKLKEFEEAVEEEINQVKEEVKQFEAVVRNWREEDKATSLIAALRGEALEVLRTITEASLNYATLISALERRYGNAHLQHVYQAQLRSRRQRFEETLQQYEADISRMVNLAYPTAPTEVIEQLSVSSFIEGLRDPEIGQLVRLARHKTISEALAQALEIEAAKQAFRGTRKLDKLKPINTRIVRGKYRDLVRILLIPSRMSWKSLPMDKTPKIPRRIKEDPSVVGPVVLKDTYEVALGGRGLVRCYQAPPVKKIKITQLQNNGSSLVVPGRICGRECEMILDTGSSHTIVKPNIVAHCRIQNTDEDYQWRPPMEKLSHTEEDETVIVEPKSENLLHYKGILTGRTLTVRKNNQMFVRIMNLQDYPQQISKGEPYRRTKLDGSEEWGADTLAREQREDPDVGDIAQWKIEGKERPAWQEISNRSPTFKGYWALWDSLAIENNLLKRVWESPDGKERNYQTILPRKRVPEVLQAVHSGVGGGHFGINKTLDKVRERFYWLGSRSDVEEWCRRSYRSAVHESTGKTPASVVFGAKLRLPIDLISDRPKEEEGVDNYLSRLQDRLRLTHTEVRQFKLKSDRMKTRYDLRANTRGFQVGEKVWLYNPKRSKGKSPKLQKSWEGPYSVVTRLNDIVYRIQKNPQAKMKIVHIDRLTPYQEPRPNEEMT